jgi:hypothetical protein
VASVRLIIDGMTVFYFGLNDASMVFFGKEWDRKTIPLWIQPMNRFVATLAQRHEIILHILVSDVLVGRVMNLK